MMMKHKVATLVACLLLASMLSPLAVKAQTCKDSITATTPASDFTIHGNGIVTHNKTGLTWQQCGEGQTYITGGGCSGLVGMFTWQQALERAAAVNAGTVGDRHGYADWRLPNKNELQSIVEYSCYNPAVNATIFPDTSSVYFWSSSPTTYASNSSWAVSFYDGVVDTCYSFRNANKAVRLVRGGQFLGLTVPDAPVVGIATPSSGQATVTFTASPSFVLYGGETTGYTVTSHPEGGVDLDAGTMATFHIITGLTNGTAYTFTVTATNAVGESAPSAPSNSVLPGTAGVPDAATTVTATAGNGKATITFSPSWDGGSPITGYTIIPNPPGGVDSYAGTTATSHDINFLDNGTVYTFTVTATNAIGTSAPSAPSNSVMPPVVSSPVRTWGNNYYGQIGDDSTYDRDSPRTVNNLNDVAAIAGGDGHTIALKSNGTVWTWGNNDHGQLGDGTTLNRHTPVQVSGLSGVTAIAGGYWHSMARKSDGTLWTWGSNGYGQLGDGSTTSRNTPIQVSALSGITAIAGGGRHSIALKSDGTVWTWGGNGQYTPRQVMSGVKSIAGGYLHSLALKLDGTVWTWGENTYGQLGYGTTTNSSTPGQVSDLSGVKAIAGGYSHSIALKLDSTVWTWGYNEYGQLGDGTIINKRTPVQVSGLSGVTAIAGGYLHTIALKPDGNVWGWGFNGYGELGNGTTTDSLTPRQSQAYGITAIASGGDHTIALRAIPPVSTITSPANNAVLHGTSITITGTASDSGFGLAAVEVSTDNGATWKPATGTTNWTYTWNTSVQGSYTIKSRARDLGSIQETPGLGITVNVQWPTSTVTAPINGPVVSGTSYIITGTAMDNSGGSIQQVEVSTDNGATWQPATGTTNWSYSWTLPVDGDYTVRSRATNSTGAVEQIPAGITIVVDNTGPVAFDWTVQKSFSYKKQDVAHGVAVDLQGNAYVVGDTSTGVYFNVLVVKYDTNGNEQWTRQLGGAPVDSANGVAVDQAGNVYVVGYTLGVLDGAANAGQQDMFVAKYDTDGTLQWTRQLGTTGVDVANGVAVDSGGNIFIVGSTSGSLDGNANAGGNDLFVVQYDTNGNKVWTRQLGTAAADAATAVFVGADGNLYVAGYTSGDLDGNLSAGGVDLFVVQYDTTGNRIWTRQLGSERGDGATGVAVNSDGKVFVTGWTYGGLDGNANAGGQGIYSGQDLFVVLYDTNGNKLWTRQLGTAGDDVARGVSVDASGKVSVAGWTSGGLDGNANAGSNDLFVVQYDSNGNKQWTRQFGTAAADWATSIALDPSGNACVAGYTSGGLNGNTGSGGTDLLVMRLIADVVNLNSGAIGVNTTSLTPTFFVKDRSGVAQMRLSNDGVFDDEPWEPYAASRTWTLPAGEGLQTVYAQFADGMNNISTFSGTIILDYAAPVSTITTPENGSTVAGCAGTITGTASDPRPGLRQVEVSTDGGSTWNLATGTASWSYTWTLPATGSYALQSRATDKAGNVETPGPGVATTVASTLLPPANIIVPAEDDDGNYMVSWTASPTIGVVYILEEATDSTFTTELRTVFSGTALRADITGRISGKTYFYRVKTTVACFADSAWQNSADGCRITGTGWSRVTTGYHDTFGIQSDGTLWGWGPENWSNIPARFGTANTWAQVAGGGFHYLALQTDGSLWAWGNNMNGQLGDGSYVKRTTPVRIGMETTWSQVAASGGHSLGLKSDGSLWAWGLNSYGQLGDGSTTNRNVPVRIGTANDWVQVAAGLLHTLGVKSDGSLWAWGRNDHGQVGDGSLTNRVTPVRIGTASNWAQVISGVSSSTSMALKSDGSLWAWGDNRQGQIGDGTTTDQTSPVRIGMETNWMQLAAGEFHTVGVKRDGTLWAWGDNSQGQLGDGSTTNQLAPVRIGLENNWVQVAAGDAFTVGLKSDRTLWAWGDNSYHQLGDGTLTNRSTPVPVYMPPVPKVPGAPIIGTATAGSGQATVTFSPPVSDGGSSIIGYTVTSNPGGKTASGQISPLTVIGLTNDTPYTFTVTATNAVGTGPASAPSNQVTPMQTYDVAVQTEIINGVKAIASGESHSVVLLNDGTVVAWGDNGLGQATVPAGLTGVTAIAAGSHFTVALRTGGTVLAWGNNGDGQTAIPSGLTGVAAIAAGGWHNLALKTDGTVVAWGSNSYGASHPGQASVPVGLTGVTAIAAGYVHSVALKADGTVVAWGDNSYGQTTIPSGLTGVTAIAAGKYHTVALKNDGTVVVWGENDYGVTTVPSNLTGVTAIAAGWAHTVALKNDGTVVAWGYNAFGQATIPGDLSGVTAIAAGMYNTMAMKADGTVVDWGKNSYVASNLITGGTILCVSPVIKGADSLCTITPAPGFQLTTFAVNGTDQLAQVSNNSYPISNLQADQIVTGSFRPVIPGAPIIGTATAGTGQATVTFSPPLSDGGIPITHYTVTANPGGMMASGATSPVTVSGLTNGTTYTFTVTASNVRYTGAASAPSNPVTPFPIYNVAVHREVSSVKAIAAGRYHTVALKNDGTVEAWMVRKDYDNGQTTVPAGLTGVTAIAAGGHQTAALKNDGTVVTWGSSGRYTPNGLAGVTAVAVGGYHLVALKNDGTVVAWGNDYFGQSTIPSGLTGVVAVAAGDYHTVALKSDGTVVAWGSNIYGYGQTTSGQATVPSGLTGVVAIAAGGYHTVALKNDGTVVAWGFNWDGIVTVPSGLTGVTAITAGSYHTVALKNDGTVVAWGNNDYGQTTIPSDLTGVTALAAGYSHTLALKNDGIPVIWGDFYSGQAIVPIGLYGEITGGTIVCESPVPSDANSVCTIAPAPGYRLTAFAVNGADKLALVSNNSYTITNIQADQVVTGFFTRMVPSTPTIGTATAGNGQALVSFTPPLSDGGSPIVGYTVTANPGGMSASGDSSPITVSGLTNGTAYTFTVTAGNALGTGVASAPSNSVTPATVPGAPIIGTATAGNGQATVTFVPSADNGGSPITGYTVTATPGGKTASGTMSPLTVSGLTNDTTYTFTVTAGNAVGTGAVSAPSNPVTPLLTYNVLAQVQWVDNLKPVAAGYGHTVALQDDGTVVAWGYNNFGQTTVPTGLTGVTAFAAGTYHTVALQSNGTVVAWGANEYGQATVPAGLAGVTAIAVGGLHSVALKNNGTVVAWGYNGGDGQPNTVPQSLTGVIAIAAAGNHTVALKNNGTVVAWGSNWESPAITIPSGLSGVTAIAAGIFHSVALKNNGTVVAWGNNNYGQTTIPSDLAGVTAIAAGGEHTVALKNDGTVVAWGRNDYGQATVPDGLTGVTVIAAGWAHTLALKKDGTVVAWGNNDFGQTTVPSNFSGEMIGGTLLCESPVLPGGSSSCAITPDLGYYLTEFKVNGMDRLAEVSNNSFTLNNVQADQIVVGVFGHGYTANVPVGNSVTVTPGPATAVTFSQVVTPGILTVAENVNPAMPQGFALLPGTVHDLTFTGAMNGPVAVCFAYLHSELPTGTMEEELLLFHEEGGQWVDITTGVDPGANQVCGEVTSFSPFMIVAPIVDGDGDGYFAGIDDCIDGDPAIHPGTAEICDDGIDNNCDGLVDEADAVCQAPTSYFYYFPSIKDSDPLGWENYLSVQAKEPVVMEATLKVYDMAGILKGTYSYSNTIPDANTGALAPNARVALRPGWIIGSAAMPVPIEGSVVVETSVPAIASTNSIANFYKGFSIYEAAKARQVHNFPKAYDGPAAPFYQVYMLVQNSQDQAVTVTVRLFGKTAADPGHGASKSYTIPAHGTLKVRPGEVAPIDAITGKAIDFSGSVVITSDLATPGDGLGPAIPAMCRFEAGSEVLAIYESTVEQPALSFPVIKDGKFGGALDYQNFVSVVNPNITATAAITLVLYNKAGVEEARMSTIILPGGKKTWRPSWLKGTLAVPKDFEGSMVVTTDIPVVGQTNTIYPGTNPYGADGFDLLESSLPAPTLFFPKAYDNLLGAGTGATHLTDNVVYVQNPDGTARNVTIELYNNNGTLNRSLAAAIAPHATHHFRPKDLVTDGSGIFRGSVKVTEQSGLPLTGGIKYEVHQTTTATSGIEAMTIYRSMGQ